MVLQVAVETVLQVVLQAVPVALISIKNIMGDLNYFKSLFFFIFQIKFAIIFLRNPFFPYFNSFLLNL